MKIWLVSNILRNLNYQESFSRKIYFIIKAFQWRKGWSVEVEMACLGGVKSTLNINIPENFMLLALAHILNQFLWQLNLILWWEDMTETPNPSRDRGHCTGLGTLTFLNISSWIPAICSVLVVVWCDEPSDIRHQVHHISHFLLELTLQF